MTGYTPQGSTPYTSYKPVVDPEHPARVQRVREAFSRKALKRICQMQEHQFGEAYGMTKYVTDEQKAPSDYFFYRNTGSRVLAVAHLDTVVTHDRRQTSFAETAAGLVVHSGALDDRLGAYIILDLLPKLGLNYDVLLTTGEEKGQSTAAFFVEPIIEDGQYDWLIEFDRGGTDVVMYCYDNAETRQMVRDCGATPGWGSFSDIAYLEHLGIKGFNWGVGYQDYHTVRGYAFLEDTFKMVAYYLNFHEQNEGTYMIHYKKPAPTYGGSRGGLGSSFLGSENTGGSSRGSSFRDSALTAESSDDWKAYVGQVAAATGLTEAEVEAEILSGDLDLDDDAPVPPDPEGEGLFDLEQFEAESTWVRYIKRVAELAGISVSQAQDRILEPEDKWSLALLVATQQADDEEWELFEKAKQDAKTKGKVEDIPCSNNCKGEDCRQPWHEQVQREFGETVEGVSEPRVEDEPDYDEYPTQEKINRVLARLEEQP